MIFKYFKFLRFNKKFIKMEEELLPLMQRSCDWKVTNYNFAKALIHKESGLILQHTNNGKLWLIGTEEIMLSSNRVKHSYKILKKKLTMRYNTNKILNDLKCFRCNIKLINWYKTELVRDTGKFNDIKKYLDEFEHEKLYKGEQFYIIWFKNIEDKTLFDLTWN